MRAGTDPLYFPGMAAEVTVVKNGKEINVGSFGVVHPDVLKNYEIIYPCTVCEIDLEALL